MLKKIFFTLYLLSINSIANAEYVGQSDVADIRLAFGIYFLGQGSYSVSLGAVPLDQAIAKTNEILNGRQLNPEDVVRTIIGVMQGQCKGHGDYSKYDQCLKVRGQEAVNVLTQFIEGLSQVSPAIDFSKDAYLVKFIQEVAKRNYESVLEPVKINGFRDYWVPYMEIIEQKLISKGQDIHQCGVMFELSRLAVLERVEKYAKLGVDVNQLSCEGFTAIGYALTGRTMQEPYGPSYYGSKMWRERNREIAKFLYSQGAVITKNNLIAYLNDDLHAAAPVLADLNKFKPFDLNQLTDMIPLTFPTKTNSSRRSGRLQELFSIGVDAKKNSLLWQLVKIEGIASEAAIDFTVKLIAAGADVNEENNGKSLVQYLTERGQVKWTISLCNSGATDPICKLP